MMHKNREAELGQLELNFSSLEICISKAFDFPEHGKKAEGLMIN